MVQWPQPASEHYPAAWSLQPHNRTGERMGKENLRKLMCQDKMPSIREGRREGEHKPKGEKALTTSQKLTDSQPVTKQ